MKLYPKGIRPSTLEERRSFYKQEFDPAALSRWIAGRANRMKFAMILGRYTGEVVHGKEELKNDVVIIDSWRTSNDLRRYALDYLPESMYYDRNRYLDVRKCRGCNGEDCWECNEFDGQQLAFDLDPENVYCPFHGHIGQKIDAGRVLGFCMFEFKAVRRQAARLAAELRKEYEFVSVAYSGRGFHVIVDDESAYDLTRSERKRLARAVGRRFDIDEWVTEGGSRLMRLPGSLNGLVSRKCLLMKDERVLLSFDPRTSRSAIPKFMKRA